MLSARAYSFRLKSRLAISLSWVAGYTNVITFLICGAVTAHATGNVTHFGERLSDRAWAPAAYFGFVVAAFFAGAVASAVMTEGARRRGVASKYILPMAVEAALLAALAVTIAYFRLTSRTHVTPARPEMLYWLSGVASFAMGLQNATITRVSGAVVRTTHLTGVVTDLGLEGVQYVLWAWDKTRGAGPGASGGPARGGSRPGRRGRVWRVSRRHPSVLRLALLASILGSFLFGVLAGALAFGRWPQYALLAPVAFLLWIIWADYRKPIADVRELDLLADPEFVPPGYGPVKSLLPPGLGIYRLIHPRRDAPHHAPDFGLWVDRLPKQWRVVILAVSPMTHFDPDAVLDLAAAAQRLRARRKDLVVCGANRAQFKALHAGGLVGALGVANFAPDLDLAIARGMNRVGELAGANAEGRMTNNE